MAPLFVMKHKLCLGCYGYFVFLGDVEISIGAGNSKSVSTDLDTIQLSIFSHR